MKTIYASYFSVIVFSLLIILHGCKESTLSMNYSVISIDNEQPTRFMPKKAKLNEGIRIYMPDDPFKAFWLENWNSSSQSIQWIVDVKEEDYYQAEVLICLNQVETTEEIILELSDGVRNIQSAVSGAEWQRFTFEKPIKLKKGTSTITLRILTNGKSPDFNIHLYSLELTSPSLKAELNKREKELRSNTEWMGKLKYGFFFHWNANSMPSHGEQKSYEDAVTDFNVENFAKMVNDCGGELVFFTTSWANANFPAPLNTFDAILPGRTSKRDLVSDMSDALGKYNIKLILYYNVKGDDMWQKAQAYSKETPENLFNNLENIIGEISDRYGKKIAGFWLDDGMGYYPNGANFERITRTAKRGNKDLVICYNSWIFPKLTNFQDYFGGELGLSEKSSGIENPYLKVGGNGVFIGGPQSGLQATYCGLLEPGDWTHINKDTEIPDPLLTADQLIKIVEESNKRKNLPMINVRIYQDGTISPKTYNLLKEVKERIDK